MNVEYAIKIDEVVSNTNPKDLANYLYINYVKYATELSIYLEQEERIAFNEAIEYLQDK